MMKSYEVENLRRSVVMLNPGQMALTKEEALEVLRQLHELQTAEEKRTAET
jgi:hypothetical protein